MSIGIIATAVKHLIAAGVTGDALVTAIAEMEEAQKPVKSKEAVRQARYRDRNKHNGDVTRYGLPPNGFPDPSFTPIKENPPKGGQKKVPPAETKLPDWLPLLEWEAFKQMRTKIKKPMTLHAETLALNKLEAFRGKGHDPTVILNQSILNNYQDLFEPKGLGNASASKHTSAFNQPNKNERAIAAARRAAQAGGFASGSFGEAAVISDANAVFSNAETIRERTGKP